MRVSCQQYISLHLFLIKLTLDHGFGIPDATEGAKAAFMDATASIASNPNLLSLVKTMRSGFSTWIIRLMKTLAVQWASCFGKTSSQGVFL
ncbi:hypothetical protein Tco_1295539, partial [Tanacetum coccineum]